MRINKINVKCCIIIVIIVIIVIIALKGCHQSHPFHSLSCKCIGSIWYINI